MLLIEIILSILYYLLNFYILCVVIGGVLSLVGANPANPIVVFLNVLTRPPCRALARKFPKLLVRSEQGFLDLSPVVLVLILGCALIVLQKVALHLGIYL